MTAALVTLAFLIAGWIAVVVMARTLEESALRIATALGGRPMQEVALPVATVALRISPRYPVQRPQRTLPRPALRAAA